MNSVIYGVLKEEKQRNSEMQEVYRLGIESLRKDSMRVLPCSVRLGTRGSPHSSYSLGCLVEYCRYQSLMVSDRMPFDFPFRPNVLRRLACVVRCRLFDLHNYIKSRTIHYQMHQGNSGAVNCLRINIIEIISNDLSNIVTFLIFNITYLLPFCFWWKIG